MTHDDEDAILAHIFSRTEPEGDCLVWTAHCGANEAPKMTMRERGAHGPVRRVLWLLLRGPVRKGFKVGVTCETPRCVHPDCLKPRSHSATMRRVGKRNAAARARIAVAARKRSKLTLDLVREIRDSTAKGAVLDRKHGLFKGHSSRIRRQKIWRDSTPFAGLGA